MRIAVVYNRLSQKVINLFGIPSREKYGQQAIQRICRALRRGGHRVIALEGDKDIVTRLEDFMPRVLKGERPGMVFNLSYGIQGQARYTHVPGILEMLGVPYVGSGPLAHSLALDKVVAKLIFQQRSLPTPDFFVAEGASPQPADLPFPLIVKPRNEAVSFGLRIVSNPGELEEAVSDITRAYNSSVLVERYVEGREINVGILGNNPPQAFMPAEIIFGAGGPPIYTYEDKTRASNREIGVRCPAPLSTQATAEAQDLALRAFSALGCYDCARVDMRLDAEGRFQILELNSLPSLGEHGSYVAAAEHAGLGFPALINRLVEVASARYFGTPTPPQIGPDPGDPQEKIFTYLVGQRDRMERTLSDWLSVPSRTNDQIGIRLAAKRLDEHLRRINLAPAASHTEAPFVWTWETRRGFEGGVLLVAHIDVPLDGDAPHQEFRRDPEWLYGEGIGSSRGPLVMLEYALRALRAQRRLSKLPLGILCYADEGRDCQFSSEMIREAAKRARHVLVLRPGNPEDRMITARRGQRRFRLLVEGKPARVGRSGRRPELLLWLATRLTQMSQLTSRPERVAVSATEVKTEAFPFLLPHRLSASIVITSPDEKTTDATENRLREILSGDRTRWRLERISDRPPMKERRANTRLSRSFLRAAEKWAIPLRTESSTWPSVAGLVPASIGTLCGIGPVARELSTPSEAIQRISLIQRTLLLSSFLAQDLTEGGGRHAPSR